MATAQHRIILVNEYQTKGLSKVSGGVTQATGSFDKLNDAMETTHKKTKPFLRRFTEMRWAIVNVAMAAALAYGAFRLLVKPSLELESAMANVRRTTGMSREELAGLKKEIIDLSTFLPISAVELAEIATVAGQLGIQGADSIREFTTVVGMMSVATEMTAEDAAKNLAKITAAFKLSIAEVNNLGSAINQLGNTTAATATEIANALKRVGASAANLGLSVPMVSALTATLINAGMGAERAGTRMRTALTRINQNLSAFAELTNMTIPAFANLLENDADAAVLKILRSLEQFGTASERAKKTTELFGRIGSFAIQTLSAKYDDLIENLEIANKEMELGLSLIIETGKAAETTEKQWVKLGNKVKQVLFTDNKLLKNFIEGTRLWLEFDGLGALFSDEGAIPNIHGSAIKLLKELTAEVTTLAGKAGVTQEQFSEMWENIFDQPTKMLMIDQTKLYIEMLKSQIKLGKDVAEGGKDIVGIFSSYNDALNEYISAADAKDAAESSSIENYIKMSDELGAVKTEIEKTFGSDILSMIEQYYNHQKKTTEEVEKAIDPTKRYKLMIEELQSELRTVNRDLSNVRASIGDVNSEISNILSRRFNISGISETDIGHLIRQQQIEIQKAKFATMGLGTAEEFLRNSTIITTDSIDQQTEAVKRLTKASETGQDMFDAWQTTLQETIRSLLINSQDLDKDVTSVVRKAQTELLGITRFDRSGGDQFSAMEQNLNALGMAQDIFFGSEREKLDYSEQLREDRINGMNESAEMAITNLEEERSQLDQLIEAEEKWMVLADQKKKKIEELRDLIRELNSEVAMQTRLTELGITDPAVWAASRGEGGQMGQPKPPTPTFDINKIFPIFEQLTNIGTVAPLEKKLGDISGMDVKIYIDGYKGSPKELAIQVKKELTSLG